MTQHDYSTEQLAQLQPEHRFFVGVDSDGCVFDTMEIKQKQCFHPLIISTWHLESIERYLRESAEFVNLYSQTRGSNRFAALLKSIELLRERPEVRESGVALPDFTSLRNFVESGVPLGNPQLEDLVARSPDPELARVLAWSHTVNKVVAATVTNVPPFKWVRESLESFHNRADAIVVSQTPTSALVREWKQHALLHLVRIIAGQEYGTKTEHVAAAAAGRYEPTRILIIGDAPGDLKAARQNGALFYPIRPGEETASWKQFLDESVDRFFAGAYAGAYERSLIDRFEQSLPQVPPWKAT
jgi:phosphoglycolate phosphatase-like HAD superfamily hydrolase